MPLFDVYYMKPEFFPKGVLGPKLMRPEDVPTLKTLQRSHTFIKVLEAASRDAVFGAMQAERWSPNGEAAGLIRSLGLMHTSMCVGDICLSQGFGWIVDNVGWHTMIPE